MRVARVAVIKVWQRQAEFPTWKPSGLLDALSAQVA